MVKLIFLCQRRPELSPADYATRLLQGHVPLAIRHHPAMRRYVVNIVEQTPPNEEAFDSVGELWFDTLTDFHQRLYDSPAGRAIIEKDVGGFLARADAYVTREHVQKDEVPAAAPGTRSDGLKLLCPLQRRPGMSHDAFVDHWLGSHVPLAKRHHPRLRRYVTNVVEQHLSPTGADWDGFAELTFASADDFRDGLFDSPVGERIVRDDIARFIGRTGAYWVAEYVEKRAHASTS